MSLISFDALALAFIATVLLREVLGRTPRRRANDRAA